MIEAINFCVYSNKELKDMSNDDYKNAFQTNDNLKEASRIYLEAFLKYIINQKKGA